MEYAVGGNNVSMCILGAGWRLCHSMAGGKDTIDQYIVDLWIYTWFMYLN